MRVFFIKRKLSLLLKLFLKIEITTSPLI